MDSPKSTSGFRLTSALALEVYFSRQLGFSLLAIGALNILLTGSVPLSSRLSEGRMPSDRNVPQPSDAPQEPPRQQPTPKLPTLSPRSR
jgi:hypothetical protein